MPLRNHFHDASRLGGWESFHATWAVVIARALNRSLPARYRASAEVRLGIHVTPDVTTEERDSYPCDPALLPGNGTAAAVWAPPAPTASLEKDLPPLDVYGVRVHDAHTGGRIVAAIELISPGNKDCPDSRDAFYGKCVALLEKQVCLVLVDVVTSRSANLHAELMRRFAKQPVEPMENGVLYATAYRGVKVGDRWGLDVWTYRLEVGGELPRPPMWLSHEEVVPVELEATYMETGRDLRLW